MQNFLVLGYIPGTHIQITFQMWLQVVAILLVLLLGRILLQHSRGIAVLVLSLYVRRVINAQQLLTLNG